MKAQAGVGGRGKAGGIGFANPADEVADFIRAHADKSINNRKIAGLTVEQKPSHVSRRQPRPGR